MRRLTIGGLVAAVIVAAFVAGCGPRVRRVDSLPAATVAATVTPEQSADDPQPEATTRTTPKDDSADSGTDSSSGSGSAGSNSGSKSGAGTNSAGKKPGKQSENAAAGIDIEAVDAELDAMQEELTDLNMPAADDFSDAEKAVY